MSQWISSTFTECFSSLSRLKPVNLCHHRRLLSQTLILHVFVIGHHKGLMFDILIATEELLKWHEHGLIKLRLS